MDKRKNGWILGAGKYNQELHKKNLKIYSLNPQYCLFCKKILEYAPEFLRKERKFCSKCCSARYHNKQRIENNFYKKGLTKISKCVSCKKEVHVGINASHKWTKCKECRIKIKIQKPQKEIRCSLCQKLVNIAGRTTCGLKCATKARLIGARKGGKKSAQLQSTIRRSKNEIYFANLCKDKFKNINTNKAIFNGWDADIILPDHKIAVLWNGAWHYKKITQKHSVKQVQNRDSIKIKEINNCGFKSYIIKDMGKSNKKFVEEEFAKFLLFVKNSGGRN